MFRTHSLKNQLTKRYLECALRKGHGCRIYHFEVKYSKIKHTCRMNYWKKSVHMYTPISSPICNMPC